MASLQTVIDTINHRQAYSALEVIGNLTDKEKFDLITNSEGGRIALDSILLTIINAKKANDSKVRHVDTDLVPPMVPKPSVEIKSWADATEAAEAAAKKPSGQPAVLSVENLSNGNHPVRILKNPNHSAGQVPRVVVPLTETKSEPAPKATEQNQEQAPRVNGNHANGWKRKPRIPADEDPKGRVQSLDQPKPVEHAKPANNFQRFDGPKKFQLNSVLGKSSDKDTETPFQIVGANGKPMHCMPSFVIDPRKGLELVKICEGRFGDEKPPIFSADDMKRFGYVEQTHTNSSMSVLSLFNLFPKEFSHRRVVEPKEIADYLAGKRGGSKFFSYMIDGTMLFSITPVVRIGTTTETVRPDGTTTPFIPPNRFPGLFELIGNKLVLYAVRKTNNPEYSGTVLIATVLLLASPQIINACYDGYHVEIGQKIARYLAANDADTKSIISLANVIRHTGVFSSKPRKYQEQMTAPESAQQDPMSPSVTPPKSPPTAPVQPAPVQPTTEVTVQPTAETTA